MDPSQYNPPLPYDRYVNRELPILPHSASSHSISQGYFVDNHQQPSPGGDPHGVAPNMSADPFSLQFGKPGVMGGRPMLPWMGPGNEHGLVDLPPSDLGHVDPMMVGMMSPQMHNMAADGHMNGNFMAVDQVLSASREKNGPATIRSWTLARQATVAQRKSWWANCRPCQYIGVFVFIGVLAVIGYAVYNGGKSKRIYNYLFENIV